MFYEHKVSLAGMDVDGHGICKASALLNHLQVAATLAAEAGGFGRRELLDQVGGVWMLARSWFRLDRPLRWGEDILIRTWHRGGKGAISYRDYDIYADGVLVGESVAAWVMVNPETGKIIPLSGIKLLQETDGGPLCKSTTLAKLRKPDQLEEGERRLMRYSDTDINGHINNTRYADFVCDLLEMDKLEGEGKFLSSMRLGYVAQCRPGERLTLLSGPDREGGTYLCALDETGKTRFECAVIFGENPFLTSK